MKAEVTSGACSTTNLGEAGCDIRKRGGIQPGYLDYMISMQRGPHASYYGVMIWVAMMLEQWLQANEH